MLKIWYSGRFGVAELISDLRSEEPESSWSPQASVSKVMEDFKKIAEI